MPRCGAARPGRRRSKPTISAPAPTRRAGSARRHGHGTPLHSPQTRTDAKTLQDKVAGVTGAASGIGRAIAEHFAAAGAKAAIPALKTEDAESAEERLVGERDVRT